MTVEREWEIRRLMALPYQIELIPDVTCGLCASLICLDASARVTHRKRR